MYLKNKLLEATLILLQYFRYNFLEILFTTTLSFCIYLIKSLLSSAESHTAAHHAVFHSTGHFVNDDLGSAACVLCVCIYWRLCASIV